jgi:uncharacterized protein (TIGR00255 family)
MLTLSSAAMSIHSMTGFGRGAHHNSLHHATVELSSVNRKQAELAFSAARELNSLEPRIRQLALSRISRGRLQVNLHVARVNSDAGALDVDLAMVRSLEEAFRKISSEVGRTVLAGAEDFLRLPGLIRVQDTAIDAEAAWEVVEPALHAAMEQFQQARQLEGAALAHDIASRLGQLEKFLREIEAAAPARATKQAEALRRRLIELDCPIDVDDERVRKEIALFADRCDISEEITRLACHLTKFRNDLAQSAAPGRALDFLCQEIHREFNTIGAKAMDSSIAQAVVQAKTELEKIREQVQNIE